MKVSFVIVSHNRRERLVETLRILARQRAEAAEASEVCVVDNGSTDGTAEAVAKLAPSVNLIRRSRNEGVSARNHGIRRAAGEYVVLLDDDSYPLGDTVARSVAHLDRRPDVAAVVGRVVLPNGACEACALPLVILSGAVCARREALLSVGGFRREFFRKGGEYDVSFRLLDAGWGIERYEDLVYRHEKHAAGRSRALAHRMDLRNNLILVARFLPPAMRKIYRRDWSQRYGALGRAAGHGSAVRRALVEARLWAGHEAVTGRQILSRATLERVFEWERQAALVAEWAGAERVRRVAIADFGKNVYATWQAAHRGGLTVVSIVETNPALVGMSYRGAPIQSLRPEALEGCDGVVLSNVNPAQVEDRLAGIRAVYDGPVLRLWRPATLGRTSAALAEAAA